jgi:N-acetylneuraminate synthase/N,N'-diacetyllegionaminate synthase
MKIGEHDIDKRVLLVAEIGANHEGSFEAAKALLQNAAEAGADAVKFQAYYIRALRFISPQADPERFEGSQRNELTLDQFRELAERTRGAGLTFLCTCFDPDTVDALNDDLPAFKVASGDLTNVPLLRAVAATEKPILLSTGMGTDEEIRRALEVIAGGSDISRLADRVVLLQCTASYPCPPSQVHLRAIPHLRREFGVRVGYSDHTLGMLACQAAIAAGARVIEKHFTDQKDGRTFRDHALSADPSDFRTLASAAREIEELRGDDAKTVQPVEEVNLKPMRRSIGVCRDIAAGTRLTEEMLVALRPAVGWPAEEIDALIGRTLTRPLAAGELIQPECLENI